MHDNFVFHKKRFKMVKQLVSFGNHMVGTLYREFIDNPEAKDFDAWLRGREVTLADLQTWQEKNPDLYVPEEESPAE